MPMTPDQKAAAALARRERDRAWRARRAQRRQMEDAGKAKIAARFDPEFAVAEANVRALEEERDRALAEIDRQIAALQAEKEQARQRFVEPIADAHHRQRAIVDRRNAEWRELAQRVDQEFPDMIGTARWSVAAWEWAENGAQAVDAAQQAGE